jgi:thiamine transport system permease protein
VLAVVPVAFLAVFFLWPVASIIARGWSAHVVTDLLTDPGTRQVAWFTLWQAALSTVITVVVAMPGAYVLHRFEFMGRRVVLALVTVPFVLPTVVVGVAFLAYLPQRWHDTVAAILIAHVFYNYAVVVRTVGVAWSTLDPRYEEAARTLGASPWRAFREVTLPLLRPAIGAAASIVFLFTFTSFGVVLFLGGPRHPTLEVEIYRRTAQLLDLRGAAALAVLQMAALGALLWWWSRSQERRAVALRLRGRARARAPRSIAEWTLLFGTLASMVVILGLPLAALVAKSFSTPHGYGLDWWRSLGSAGQGTTRFVAPFDAIRTSLLDGTIAAIVAVAIGGLAACAIAYGRKGTRVLDTGLMLPLGTSAVTIGFGLLITMDRAPLDLRGSWILVPLAQALVAIPLVVRAVLPAVRAIDPRQRDVAAMLGASPLRSWWEVDRPLLARALAVGAGFAFAVALGEFGATTFLARQQTPTLPILIDRLLTRPGPASAGQAACLAVLLMVVTAVVLLVADRALPGSEPF